MAPAQSQEKQRLIICYGSQNPAPYSFIENGKLTAGVIKDIGEALAEFYQFDVEFVKVPRKRIDQYLQTNTIHINLVSNPAWVPNNQGIKWSEPLFVARDKLVVRSDAQEIESLDDLDGLILGTTRGYIYPTLTQHFSNAHVIRSDANSLASNFLRLDKEWIDAIVDSELAIEYQISQTQNANRYAISPLVVSEHLVQAAISPASPLSKAQLDIAIQTLQQRGQIQAILNKYK